MGLLSANRFVESSTKLNDRRLVRFNFSWQHLLPESPDPGSRCCSQQVRENLRTSQKLFHGQGSQRKVRKLFAFGVNSV